MPIYETLELVLQGRDLHPRTTVYETAAGNYSSSTLH